MRTTKKCQNVFPNPDFICKYIDQIRIRSAKLEKCNGLDP